MKRLAVVLFNLGGPDGPKAVKPFLFNLFNDKAIIGAPQPLRWLLAKYIAGKRAAVAQEIYAHMGGGSPIVELTEAQAKALQKTLSGELDDVDVHVFVSMRYWHPFSQQVAERVKDFNPDHVVLLPLYPQFSTTTTESSLADWKSSAVSAGLNVVTQSVCCYPTEPGFIEAQVDLLKAGIVDAEKSKKPFRVLFSAHGLPKKIVDNKADPYPHHVEQGARAIIDLMAAQGHAVEDWEISYQSRVGPLEWIGPSTEDEIKRAGQDKKGLVILPLAFVSEHSETLVELDIEYKELADEHGVETYVRIPAVATHEKFIKGLSSLVTQTIKSAIPLCAQGQNKKLCENTDRACPHHTIG